MYKHQEENDNVMPVASECVLCNAVMDKGRNIENIRIIESSNYIMMPGLGDFLGGYSLIVSKNHIHSSAYLEKQQVDELEKFLKICEEFLFEYLGKNVISAEHGSVLSSEKGPACVNHLHFHLFPVDIRKEDVLGFFNSFDRIKSLGDTRKFSQNDIPYILLKFPDGEIIIRDAINIQKQFVRTIISKLTGKEDEWNWVIHENLSNIRTFLKSIQRE